MLTELLYEIVTMGDHVTAEERAAFATVALDAGARMDVRDDLLKSTPLGWACRWGREELVRLFLDRGADPVEADAEPWARPLAWAEKKGHDCVLAGDRRGAVPRRDWMFQRMKARQKPLLPSQFQPGGRKKADETGLDRANTSRGRTRPATG